MTQQHTNGPVTAIIMAAGKGTRMQSELPKVLHPVGDRPMIHAVVDACREAGCERVILVVGYKQELVRESFKDDADIEFAVQAEQLGTGHAVLVTRDLFPENLNGSGVSIVLAGDGPLIRPQTLQTLLETHEEGQAAATLATAVIDDPSGYGRVMRNADRGFAGIVEQKDCSPEQLKINEVNPSYYCFDTALMFDALNRVERNEGTGEYYVTDVPAMLLADGGAVAVVDAVPAEDILSINTLEQLAIVDAVYRARHGSETRPNAAAQTGDHA